MELITGVSNRYYHTTHGATKNITGCTTTQCYISRRVFGKHERPGVHTFTNALRKNISDKGSALCTLTSPCIIVL
jgi:hypothetical protein